MKGSAILAFLAAAFLALTAAEDARRCLNLQPYEPILNGLIDAIPGRAIQDLIPLPITLADGGEVWRMRVETWLCDLDIILDQVTIQVLNTNFEKIDLDVQTRESIFLTIPFGVQATSRIHADCGLYKPKIVNQIEFAATLTSAADICIDIAALGDPTNILNYTYATISDVNYKADAQNFYWCIYDALPLLESIIDDLLNENVENIWKAVDKVLQELLFPGIETLLNRVLRAIGIQPYNATVTEDLKPFDVPLVKPAPKKTADKISVIYTSNFSALMYNDQGSGAWMDGSFYRPFSNSFPGYYPIGDYAQRNYETVKGTVQLVKDDGVFVTKPVDFEQIWIDKGSGADRDGSFWRPIPPEGFVALGHVSQNNYNKPSVDVVRVVRSDFVVRCDPWLTWTDRCSGAKTDVSIWSIAETTSPTTGVFVSNNNYGRPAREALLCLDPDRVVIENL